MWFIFLAGYGILGTFPLTHAASVPLFKTYILIYNIVNKRFTNTGNVVADSSQTAAGDMVCDSIGTIPIGNIHISKVSVVNYHLQRFVWFAPVLEGF